MWYLTGLISSLKLRWQNAFLFWPRHIFHLSLKFTKRSYSSLEPITTFLQRYNVGLQAQFKHFQLKSSGRRLVINHSSFVYIVFSLYPHVDEFHLYHPQYCKQNHKTASHHSLPLQNLSSQINFHEKNVRSNDTSANFHMQTWYYRVMILSGYF